MGHRRGRVSTPWWCPAQIVLGLQAVISRQSDLSKAAAVITIGSIHGGLRNNIIPDSVMMVGTIRTLDPGMQT